MRDFIQTLKEGLIVEKKRRMRTATTSILAGVVGICMALIITAVKGTSEGYNKIGGLMVFIFGVFHILFGEIFSLPGAFNLAVSMGKTRKSYVFAKYVIMALNVLVVICAFILINAVEEALCTALYPNADSWFDMVNLFSNHVLVAGMVVCIPAINLLCGVLLLKFSTKFFWVVWAVWMFLFAGGPRLFAVSGDRFEAIIIQSLQEMSPIRTLVSVIITAMVGMAAAVGLFAKQQVTW